MIQGFSFNLIYTREIGIVYNVDMTKIETPKISEILLEEFMKPLHLSAYKLAKEIGVPVSRIQDILHGRRSISAETSIRLGRYFHISEKYFLKLQNDIDLREAQEKIDKEKKHQ